MFECLHVVRLKVFYVNVCFAFGFVFSFGQLVISLVALAIHIHELGALYLKGGGYIGLAVEFKYQQYFSRIA